MKIAALESRPVSESKPVADSKPVESGNSTYVTMTKLNDYALKTFVNLQVRGLNERIETLERLNPRQNQPSGGSSVCNHQCDNSALTS